MLTGEESQGQLGQTARGREDEIQGRMPGSVGGSGRMQGGI